MLDKLKDIIVPKAIRDFIHRKTSSFISNQQPLYINSLGHLNRSYESACQSGGKIPTLITLVLLPILLPFFILFFAPMSIFAIIISGLSISSALIIKNTIEKIDFDDTQSKPPQPLTIKSFVFNALKTIAALAFVALMLLFPIPSLPLISLIAAYFFKAFIISFIIVRFFLYITYEPHLVMQDKQLKDNGGYNNLTYIAAFIAIIALSILGFQFMLPIYFHLGTYAFNTKCFIVFIVAAGTGLLSLFANFGNSAVYNTGYLDIDAENLNQSQKLSKSAALKWTILSLILFIAPMKIYFYPILIAATASSPVLPIIGLTIISIMSFIFISSILVTLIAKSHLASSAKQQVSSSEKKVTSLELSEKSEEKVTSFELSEKSEEKVTSFELSEKHEGIASNAPSPKPPKE